MNTDDAPNYERDNEVWDLVDTITPNQFKNLLVFIMLVSDERPGVLAIAPSYIVEKYARFVGTQRVGDLPDDERWKVGLHPLLRVHFDRYCEKWRLH